MVEARRLSVRPLLVRTAKAPSSGADGESAVVGAVEKNIKRTGLELGGEEVLVWLADGTSTAP